MSGRNLPHRDRGGDRGRDRGSRGGRGFSGDRGSSSDRGGHGGYQPGPSKMITTPASPPDAKCISYENLYAKDTAKDTQKAGQLARRPGYGTAGKAMVLRANFFEMSFNPKQEYHSYRVDITVKKDVGEDSSKIKCEDSDTSFKHADKVPKAHRQFLMDALLQQARFQGKIGTATDGTTEIVVNEPLKDTSTFYRRIGDRGVPPGDKRPIYKVTLIYQGFLKPVNFVKLLQDPKQRGAMGNETMVLRVLNIVMSAHPYKDPGIYISGKGRTKFFRMGPGKEVESMGGGVEAARGYYSSVRFGTGKILLNLNVNHGSFYRPIPLSTLIKEYMSVFGEDRDHLGRYLKGLKIYVTHLPKREDAFGKKQYVIKSILGVATPQDGKVKGANPKELPRVKRLASSPGNVEFFMNQEGRPSRYVSVLEYFEKTYNIRIKYHDMPVVNVGNLAHPNYLPLDVCEVVPGQPFAGELSNSQRQAMIKFSCRRPPMNYDSITTDGLGIMGITGGKTIERGIKVIPDMVTVPARILNTPMLKYGTQKTTPRFGSWNLANTKFCSGATIPTWACIWLRKGRDSFENPVVCMSRFTKKLREHGLRMPDSTMNLQASLSGGPGSERENRNKIKDLFDKMKTGNIKFAVVLLPDTASGVFDWIKFCGDVKSGILTHCMLAAKLGKVEDQYISNNAMKVNLKFGGANQVLDGSHSKFVGQGKTMVVGLDVTHPTSTDHMNWPSVAGIVASIDGRMAQWPGEIMIQGRRVEHVEVLQTLMERRLKLWKDNNGSLPMNILVYRDGISEGQFDVVLNFELPLIKAACKNFYDKTEPYITIVVCGKRHNVRFYPTTEKDQDRTQNPINGCIVDRIVTRPMYWDFYLQAQAPLQGSARPAHYIVIHDEIFRSPKANPESAKAADSLQELTHNICYMMGRATRSISYATPAFLADKMCDRARKYMLAEYFSETLPHGPGSDGKYPPPPANTVRLHETILSRMAYI
ncbi:hypothetical protein PENANT_c001G04239 [Penicillium antarcticum]|uniref:Piwi domain-containing protein n=1 Tax=Penicillium antarcticum TaxID=416450 RepID=A0A1V6QP59_9EURO|nr:uncharacterized protein N7508_010775 [Penicillium antarcticum]KAJ5295954.1 hypothetical protein N7508_010775 [Penicillium antarcticum]OQD91013.1 hypothetical protein PENANT_c001G04239 [Penicillium antarcticum]